MVHDKNPQKFYETLVEHTPKTTLEGLDLFKFSFIIALLSKTLLTL